MGCYTDDELCALRMSSREIEDLSHMLRKAESSWSYRLSGVSNSAMRPASMTTWVRRQLSVKRDEVNPAHDAIVVDDGPKTMRDAQQRGVRKFGPDCLLDPSVGLEIDG